MEKLRFRKSQGLFSSVHAAVFVNGCLQGGTDSKEYSMKTGCKKARLILGWLRKWLWRLFDRAMKAFFEAFFDHYSG
jgi:hypothetical protein